MTNKNALPTERIRELYGMAVHWIGDGPASVRESNLAEFDAWLEEHDTSVRAEERAAAFDEGMFALGDMIGVDSEWYDRILRPSQDNS